MASVRAACWLLVHLGVEGTQNDGGPGGDGQPVTDVSKEKGGQGHSPVSRGSRKLVLQEVKARYVGWGGHGRAQPQTRVCLLSLQAAGRSY